MKYIYPNTDWPKYYRDNDSILPILLKSKLSQDEIIGKIKI